MLKTMYQAINQVSKYYLGHYKNMLLATKEMMSPLTAAARNLMTRIPTAKSSGQQPVLLPKVQSYFDPEQGVEYWYDPTEGQWYYHYPETVAKKVGARANGEEASEANTGVGHCLADVVAGAMVGMAQT